MSSVPTGTKAIFCRPRRDLEVWLTILPSHEWHGLFSAGRRCKPTRSRPARPISATRSGRIIRAAATASARPEFGAAVCRLKIAQPFMAGLRVIHVKRTTRRNQFHQPRCAVVISDIERDGNAIHASAGAEDSAAGHPHDIPEPAASSCPVTSGGTVTSASNTARGRHMGCLMPASWPSWTHPLARHRRRLVCGCRRR